MWIAREIYVELSAASNAGMQVVPKEREAHATLSMRAGLSRKVPLGSLKYLRQELRLSWYLWLKEGMIGTLLTTQKIGEPYNTIQAGTITLLV